MEKPLQRALPSLGDEPACQLPFRQVRTASKIRDAQWEIEVRHDPGGQLRQPVLRMTGAGCRCDVLGLASCAVGWDDHSPCDAIGCCGPMVTAHQVQAQVDSGGDPGAAGYVPVVDVQDIGCDVHGRVGCA